MEIIKINQFMSYIASSENPLSADVVLIEGKDFLWLYDVGNNPDIVDIIPRSKPVNVVLSHFHPDHTGNLKLINTHNVIQGKNTFGYTHTGEIVEKDLYINDGDLKLHIFPIASCHSKGSLALTVNNEYCLLGDATYMTQKFGKRVYNSSLLKEMLDKLNSVDAGFFLESHSNPFIKSRDGVLKRLEFIYSKREKNNPYIEL